MVRFSRLRLHPSSLILLLCLSSLAAAPPTRSKSNAASPRSRRQGLSPEVRYDGLPLAFEPNRGQTDARVKFLAHAQRYTLFLTRRAAIFSPFACAKPNQGGACWVRMAMVGADSTTAIRGAAPLAGHVNYFIGSNPQNWRTRIPLYGRVAYQGVYPGIDLVYYGNPRQLEYDFALRPHADPSRIQLEFDGPGGPLPLRVNRSGELETRTSGSTLRFLRPVAFQAGPRGEKRRVDCAYVPEGSGRVSLKLGAYNHSEPLVIDPALAYSTYLGGSGGDAVNAIAIDASGDAYITGSTGSTNFPVSSSPAPYQKTLAGTKNSFVSELNPGGTALVYSTYVGGSQVDAGTSIAVDSSGNAYVAGYTSSADFPVTKGVLQSAYKAGATDEAFVVKLNSGGAALGYATYLGGSGADFARGIAIDSSGDAYVAGSTQSADFPTKNPYQPNLAGSSDAFVAELNPTGASLVYATFLGGSGADTAQAIALDSAGEATVAGYTASSDFPKQSAVQGTFGGGTNNAFVARLNASGSALVFSTYLGGSVDDRGNGIALDGKGDIFVAGSTESPNFLPSTLIGPGGGTCGTAPNTFPCPHAFAVELDPSGTKVLYSTVLGGSSSDQANGIAVDGSGDAYIAGSTASSNFPTSSPIEATLGEGACASACSNAFVSELNPQGNGLVYSTYLGGNGPDYGQAITVDSSGNAYVAGITFSSLFPVTGGAVQGSFSGSSNLSNGFVAKIAPGDTPALAINPQSINFGNQALGVASSPQTITLTNVSSVPVAISGFAPSDPEFAVSTNNCTASPLAPAGAQCTASVTFTPSSTASTTTATTGTLSISDNAAGSPQSVALSGTGATPGPAITYSPSPLNIPVQVLVGNSAGPYPVTLTNSGTAPLTITAVAITGSYTETDNCVATLQPGQTCTVNVTFNPKTTTGATSSSSSSSTANNTGSITVTSTPSVTTAETINGTGVADFALSSTGPTGVTLESATSATLTIGAAVVPGSPSFTGSVTLSCSSEVTCAFNPTSVTPGQTTTLTVTASGGALSTVGTNPVTFTITGTATDSSGNSQAATLAESIPLEGFALSGTPALATITAGQTASYTVTVSSVNGFTGPVALSCSSGLPAGASCAFSPATVTLAGPAVSSTLTISTTAHSGSSLVAPGSSGRLRVPPGRIALVALIGLIGLLSLAALRRKRFWLALGLLLFGALLLAGCNVGYYGFVGSNPAPTGSPSGVYTITVAGTYTPATGTTGQTATSESTTVNLAVQ